MIFHFLFYSNFLYIVTGGLSGAVDSELVSHAEVDDSSLARGASVTKTVEIGT